MTPDELKPIVEAHGGPDLFAAKINVTPRAVYYWLAEKREIRPCMVQLIKSLKTPKNRKSS